MIDNLSAHACKLEVSGAIFSPEFTRLILKQFFLFIYSAVNKRHLALIGHIKGFCLGSEKDYLKISFVSDKGGVDISGLWLHESDMISLTLNIIVLGVCRQDLIVILHEAVKETENVYRVKIVQDIDRCPQKKYKYENGKDILC